MTEKNVPTKVGLYYAKSGNYQWYNLIVEIYGESPFFKIDAWDRVKERVFIDFDPTDITEWGIKIPNPDEE